VEISEAVGTSDAEGANDLEGEAAQTADGQVEKATAVDKADAVESEAFSRVVLKGSIGWDEPPPFLAEPKCSKCGVNVDVTSAGWRLSSNVKGIWKCRVCNSKHASLTEVFGTWPIEELREPPPEGHEKFWRETGADKASVKRMVEKYILMGHIETEMSRSDGATPPAERLGDPGLRRGPDRLESSFRGPPCARQDVPGQNYHHWDGAA